MTPRFLAEATSFTVVLRNDMLGFFGSQFNICLAPRKRSFVFSGRMSK